MSDLRGAPGGGWGQAGGAGVPGGGGASHGRKGWQACAPRSLTGASPGAWQVCAGPVSLLLLFCFGSSVLNACRSF